MTDSKGEHPDLSKVMASLHAPLVMLANVMTVQDVYDDEERRVLYQHYRALKDVHANAKKHAESLRDADRKVFREASNAAEEAWSRLLAFKDEHPLLSRVAETASSGRLK